MSDLYQFFKNLQKDVAASAKAFNIYSIEAFIGEFIHELIELGDLNDFEFCENPKHIGAYIHGFNIDTNENTEAITLNLIVTDYDQRAELENLNYTELSLWFKRLLKFFKESYNHEFSNKLDPSTEVYRLADYIDVYKDKIEEVNLFFLSEREISKNLNKDLQREEFENINIKYHLWDISRLYKLKTSGLSREALEIDLANRYQQYLECLPAHIGDTALQSYLVICPGDILADLYNDYGSRLLEQNVRSFLQAKGGVNKGIRNSILKEPEYFFSYNNGITATASDVEILTKDGRVYISKIVDLQIVNGGQTTASLAKTKIKDKADLSKIFVQMKLTKVSHEQSEKIVPRISQYANTQNKVNLSDLSANHPYHIKIEELSRKMWAPPAKNTLRDSGWFYERSRGQYNEMLSGSNRVLLKIKYPKNQLFTKTDLAKYMMVWDHSEPKWVNMGAQKNFNKFSEYIIKNWKNMEIEGEINEYYFKKIVSRAIIFKETEKIVTSQPWYTNGYRANIVIYTLAYLSYYLKNQNKIIDYLKLWKEQSLTKAFEEVLVGLTREINRILISPNLARTTNNISEWAKKDACWGTILAETSKLNNCIKDEFINELMDGNLENQNNEAKNKQRLTDSISIQNKINAIDKYYWKDFLNYLEKEDTLSFKERGILKLASVGRQNLSAKQCFVLGRILDKYQKDFDEYTSAEKETRENW
ncbi:AIPR family protein [Acinetobacter baumannii]|uniref:AIPR family protein n=1 Tax=Acinetobacter baumannii TaxID=470 RepID=UPI00293F98C3|nr:AIPR family protein [Acinetobacter baumannii]MDV4327812.1 AIPR family protein [Acinetobacter baumannii]MDV4332474.1 AIPR family protein [Acinetobacter baumannii]